MKCFWLIGLALAGGLIPLHGADTPPAGNAAATPVIGITLVPWGGTFQSLGNFTRDLGVDMSSYHGEEIDSVEFEIRCLERNERILRRPYPYEIAFGRGLNDQRPYLLPRRMSDGFSEDDKRWLVDMPPGNYEIAFYANGVRASNVAQVRIDPAFDVSKAPTLQLGKIEPNPLGKYTLPVLWTIGPTPANATLTNMALVEAPITVDGVEHERAAIIWTGMVGPLRSGDRGVHFLVDPKAYPLVKQPAAITAGTNPTSQADVPSLDSKFISRPIDETVPHVYGVTCLGYSAAPVTVDPLAHPLADAWDMATATLKDAPRPPISVHGRVLDGEDKPRAYVTVNLTELAETQPAQGRPGRTYVVKTVATTIANAQGEYAFPNIAPGRYRLSVPNEVPIRLPATMSGGYRVSNGHLLKEPDFTLAANQTVEENLDNTPIPPQPYKVSGKVTDLQGQPLSGIFLRAGANKSEIIDGQRVFTNIYAITDKDGTYELGFPRNVPLFVQIITEQNGPMQKNIQPGATNVDFVYTPPARPSGRGGQ